MDDIDLAYIAGFFEGEGNAGIYKNGGNSVVLTVEICQNDPKPLHYVKEIFGYGSLCLTRKRKCNRWRVTGKPAKDFLRRIYPYCKYRQELVQSLMI